jgi:hypothetical protein
VAGGEARARGREPGPGTHRLPPAVVRGRFSGCTAAPADSGAARRFARSAMAGGRGAAAGRRTRRGGGDPREPARAVGRPPRGPWVPAPPRHVAAAAWAGGDAGVRQQRRWRSPLPPVRRGMRRPPPRRGRCGVRFGPHEARASLGRPSTRAAGVAPILNPTGPPFPAPPAAALTYGAGYLGTLGHPDLDFYPAPTPVAALADMGPLAGADAGWCVGPGAR